MGTGNSKENGSPSHEGSAQNHYVDFAPGTQAKSKNSTEDEVHVPTMFRWPYSGRRVFIVGTFNHWKEKIPMTYNSDENSFVVILNISVGKHLYRFIVDNEYKTDPNAATCKDDQGYLHNVIEIVEPNSKKYTAAHEGGSPIEEDDSYGYDDGYGDEDDEEEEEDDDFDDDGEDYGPTRVTATVIHESSQQQQQQQQQQSSILNHPDAQKHQQQQQISQQQQAPPPTITTTAAPAQQQAQQQQQPQQQQYNNNNNNNNNNQATTTTSPQHHQQHQQQHQQQHHHQKTHLRSGSETEVTDPQQQYTQIEHFFEEDKKNPPLLPPHLRYTVLNTTRKSVHDPALLPVPLHVTVNHSYFSDRESMNVIGVTQRYRDKFSTAVLYKPKKIKS